MSIASEITRLQQAKSDLATSIANKGVTVPAATTIDGYAALVDQIQTGGGLPQGAVEIEYLQSSGTQYINTGLKPNNTYTFCTTVAATQNSFNTVYWGVRSAGTSGDYNKQCFCNSNTSSTGNTYTNNINLYSTRAMSGEGNWSSGVVPVINVMYSFSNMKVVSTMEQMLYPITLFAFNVIGTVNTSAGKCRISSFRAYSSGVKKMDMIAVRVGQVGYMYDKVSGELFGNAGTGSFTLGQDIT